MRACVRADLQGIVLPLDDVQWLAGVGEVDHDEGHGGGDGCHQHGLHHLETGPVDVPEGSAQLSSASRHDTLTTRVMDKTY